MRSPSPAYGAALTFFFTALFASTGLNAIEWASTGLRLGLDDEQGDNFTGYEAFATFEPVGSWGLHEKETVLIVPEAAIGAIRGNDETAGYLRFGVAANIALGQLPISLTLNSGIQALSEDTFGNFDLGGYFNFSTGIGLNWDLNEDWVLGYRFQHTSNAGLYDTNPGLDLHSFSLAYKF